MRRHALSPLVTDLYQLTMMQAYFDNDMHDEAVFEMFFRRLPKQREFLVACGLAQVIEYLTELHFTAEDIDFLRKDGRFHQRFLNYLADLRFTGAVHAMAEGTVFFADEPIIRITAPLPLAQLVETRIINILQFQTMIASKAVRMKQVVPDKLLVDYGLRRAHGAEAGIMAARASYIAGFAGTATVLAGQLFGIPLFGTMAHSFIQAHDSEREAFIHFATSHPTNSIFLLDTYNTEHAAQRLVDLAPELTARNIAIRGVRLDSGDMVELSRKVREILDDGGLQDTLIFASGDLDEYSLARYAEEKAPVDGFGVGTKMTTSADVPYMNCAYKLVEYGGVGRRKLAEGKSTWPGRKQVYRRFDPAGTMTGDTMALESEELPGTELIHQYMRKGRQTIDLPPLSATRDYLLNQLATLPVPDRAGPDGYPVTISSQLQQLAETVCERMLRINT